MNSDLAFFCALPVRLELDASLARWTKRSLLWSITGALPNVSEVDQQVCYTTAWGFWQAICGIGCNYTDIARNADVRMGSGPIDGRGQVLAWSELPNGADGPLQQKYDTGDSWSATLDVEHIPAGLIPLLVTSAHEIGHALGLGHSINPADLMYPTLNTRSLGRPQAGDIREAQARYGPPGPVPTPPPTPKPTDKIVLTLLPNEKVILIPPGWKAT